MTTISFPKKVRAFAMTLVANPQESSNHDDKLSFVVRATSTDAAAEPTTKTYGPSGHVTALCEPDAMLTEIQVWSLGGCAAEIRLAQIFYH